MIRSNVTAFYCLLLLAAPSVALSQSEPVTTTTPEESLAPLAPGEEDTVQKRLNRLAEQAAAAIAELPEGESKELTTTVMGSTGKCQWRAKGKKIWTNAKRDQQLKPGTQIRTGRKSKLVLRLGLNATLLIDSLARVTIPVVTQHGKVLTTTVQVDRGRADVKVGHVGLTNDFSVLTPSGALAVKGTDFAVSHSALKGTQIVSARTNAIRAIEVSYYGSKVKNYLSASSVSTQETPNPTIAAAFASSGATPLTASEAVDKQDAASATTEAVSGSNAVQNSTRTLVAAQQESNAEDAVEDLPLPPDYPQNLDGWDTYLQQVVPPEDDGQLAATIYFDLRLAEYQDADGNVMTARRVPAHFENGLHSVTGWFDPSREEYLTTYNDETTLNVPWGAALPDADDSQLGAAYGSIIDYGDAVDDENDAYNATSADLNVMLQNMNEFCILTFNDDGTSVAACRLAWASALNEYLYNAAGTTSYAWALEELEQYNESGAQGDCNCD